MLGVNIKSLYYYLYPMGSMGHMFMCCSILMGKHCLIIYAIIHTWPSQWFHIFVLDIFPKFNSYLSQYLTFKVVFMNKDYIDYYILCSDNTIFLSIPKTMQYIIQSQCSKLSHILTHGWNSHVSCMWRKLKRISFWLLVNA